MKTPDYLSMAYVKGWIHCHGGGWLENNPFDPKYDIEERKYWERGFDDCASGIIDGPTALGSDYIEPKQTA